MYYYYVQLHHAIRAKVDGIEWRQSPILLFNMINSTDTSKGFISQSYSMLLMKFLKDHPVKVMVQWENDLGSLTGDELGEAFQSVITCYLSIS